jgi:hypothetical protein
VLALLALALFPVSAFAGNSGETVYETEIPSVTSEPSPGGTEKSPTHHKSPNTGNGESDQATGSNAEVGGTGSEGSEGSKSGHKKEGSSSQEEEGNPSMGAGGNGGNGNNPNGGANAGGSEGSIGESKDLGGTQAGQPVAAKSSDGGSSPVVPILIAVVVLAAISIGVVLYRQRKSDQGGSDGRVSSPNAG